MMPMLPAIDLQHRASRRSRGFDSMDLVIC
jgi:hypothetical protein